MNALVNDLLNISAIEAGKLELREDELDAADSVNFVVKLLAARSEVRDVSVSVSIQEDLPSLYADKRRLREIFLNILSNAIKFSNKGGKVSFDARIDANGHMVFKITDNGIGMNDKELIKAMEKFGQADSSHSRRFEGTGLGIPLTKALIELHGGNFDIKSERNAGTIVTLTFPKIRVGGDVETLGSRLIQIQ